jgi:hypothetical protein
LYGLRRYFVILLSAGPERGVDTRQAYAEVAVSQIENIFRMTPDGYYMELRGPGWHHGERPCQKKLCFVATDRVLLAEVLSLLIGRPDCYYVKYSVQPRDGMYLGRCFLTDEQEIGQLWAEYKQHPRLFCSVQDDEFAARFRRRC